MKTQYEFLNATHLIIIDAISMQAGIQLGVNTNSRWYHDEAITEMLASS
ncbi:MAG: hypothetical protein LBP56_00305 [Odoribacteraceae bacterium]|nr:hypothetical protein [Odoribacteraceae bacterium]